MSRPAFGMRHPYNQVCGGLAQPPVPLHTLAAAHMHVCCLQVLPGRLCHALLRFPAQRCAGLSGARRKAQPDAVPPHGVRCAVCRGPPLHSCLARCPPGSQHVGNRGGVSQSCSSRAARAAVAALPVARSLLCQLAQVAVQMHATCTTRLCHHQTGCPVEPPFPPVANSSCAAHPRHKRAPGATLLHAASTPQPRPWAGAYVPLHHRLGRPLLLLHPPQAQHLCLSLPVRPAALCGQQKAVPIPKQVYEPLRAD